MKKFAVLTSHPIQYLIPLFRALDENKTIKTEIWFNNDFGDKPFFDPDFKTTIKWDIDLLHGYKGRLLKNISPRPSTGFLGQINPGVIMLLLGRYKPDVMMIWGWNSITHLITIVVAKLAGVKLLLRAETTLDYEIGLPLMKRLIKKFILRQLFRFFDGYLYLGQQNLKFYNYIGVPEEKLHFMPYCVSRYDPKMSIRLLDQFGRFIFVGKLSYKKRPDIIIDAFQDLCNSYPDRDLKLTIVGDGEMRDEVIEKCNKNASAHYHGFANQSELQALYKAHDVIILPSDERETWGLVVNEALSHGLAAITSDRVGCREDLIKEGKNGAIFSYGEKTALFNHMAAIINGEMNADQIRQQNIEIASIYNHDTGVKIITSLCHD